MNRLSTFAMRLKSLALAAALACGFAMPAVQAATVTLSGTTGTSCTYTSATTDSSGNVTYVCQGSVAPPPPPPPSDSPPVCTLSATPNPVAVGGSVTFTGGCTGGDPQFNWLTAGAPGPWSLNTPLLFPSAGTFVYEISAYNAFGIDRKTVTVEVRAGSTNEPQPGNCPSVSTVGPRSGFTDLGNLRFDLKPSEIGSKQFSFPSEGRRQLKIGTIFGTSSETPYGTDVQVSVSECPGQFTGISASCIGNFSRNGGSLYVGDSTECALEDGKTYYVNMRHVKYQSNPPANSCVSPPYGYCTHYMKFNSF
jgi:hypothetical protein